MLALRKINNLPGLVEGNDEYRIEVAAPSLKKDDFKINLENDLLTISANKEESKEDKSETFTRREFSYSSFSRSFTLPETVNGEKISAEYKDGILKVNVPKREVAKAKPAKEIAIK